MNTKLVNAFLAGGIVATLAALLMSGCASPMNDMLYQSKQRVTVVVHDGGQRSSVMPDLCWISVTRDGDHPDYYALGREVWVMLQGT